MNKKIQPSYGPMQVRCSCGHTFTTASVRGKDLNIEVCHACHPFYTGKQKFIDTAGRLDTFSKKFGAFSVMKNTVGAEKSGR